MIIAFFLGRKLHIVAVEFRQVVVIVLVTAKFAVFERVVDRFRDLFQIQDAVVQVSYPFELKSVVIASVITRKKLQ